MAQPDSSQIMFALKAAAVGFVIALAYLLLTQSWPRTQAPVEIVHSARQTDASSGADVRTGQVSYAAAVTAAAPSVVNIFTATAARPDGGVDTPLFRELFRGNAGLDPAPNIRTSAGSGIIVSAAGHIVTNNHLIADADEINVMLNTGAGYPARIIGTDPETDLAVLAVAAEGLPAITLAPAGSLQVGDVVLAIGNPLGAGQTVTMGIVSATGRNRVGLHTFEDFIQTDAAINPGNSGGALINPHGELVGVNTAIFTQEGGASAGLGLATPVDQVQAVVEQIIRHGRVIRGWLGVVARDLGAGVRRELGLPLQGVVVTGVIEGGPAALAGLRSGDVISAIDETPVADSASLLQLTTLAAPGTRVTVHGSRADTRFSVDAELIQRPLPQNSR